MTGYVLLNEWIMRHEGVVTLYSSSNTICHPGCQTASSQSQKLSEKPKLKQTALPQVSSSTYQIWSSSSSCQLVLQIHKEHPRAVASSSSISTKSILKLLPARPPDPQRWATEVGFSACKFVRDLQSKKKRWKNELEFWYRHSQEKISKEQVL